MLHVSIFQITQILLVTAAFCLHLFTFYHLSYAWGANMVIFETTVYGTYFVVKIGYLIAVLSDGTFTPPLEAMTKLHGAVLYNILGVISLTHYATESSMKQLQEFGHLFSVIKGIVAIFCSITYYYDLFQA